VTQPCIVLIAAPDLLPALTERARQTDAELLTFPDTDALRALDAITRRRPRLVALERLFATTPRGAALINRIKADPTLTESEIRVVSHDATHARQPAADSGTSPQPVARPTATVGPARPLDQTGTRRAPRYTMAKSVEIVVDGNVATIVNASIIGAQVLSATSLKPNQRVRVALSDATGTERFNGVVAWASFEIPTGTAPRYRAGIEFIDADPVAMTAFCDRHKQP
jgi:hypothetical protein